MAEDEVVKHTKKIYNIWTNHEVSFWHKAKEFFVEVLIIVFAVTLSIWFHNWAEHTKQQEDVKEFLLGLKSDLQHDIAEMKGDKESYLMQEAGFSYITRVKMHQQLRIDSLNKYANWLFNTTALNPNNGRFEGFKSAGKIGFIENRELQNYIMDLYQEDIVALLASTAGYIEVKKQFFDYVRKNNKRVTDSTSNIATILVEDECQNICRSLNRPIQVLERYDACISKMQIIITEIDKEYYLKN